MEQSVLKGSDIFLNLSKDLNKAKKSIVVVTAWFTDQTLLDILVLKLNNDVEVSVVISENRENNKLDFTQYLNSGGYLKRIKNKKGYGMMHQKYCIIDNEIVFHGSYNWTLNARKNNSESVIKTNHKSTIQDLIEDFKKMTIVNKEENESPEIKEGKKNSTFLYKLFGKNNKENEQKDIEKENTSFNLNNGNISINDIFTSIISAEAKKTDVDNLKQKGVELCKEVSGDHNVLSKSMNSLYHIYISDNAENIELKEKLVLKIKKKKEELIQLEEIDRAKKIASDEVYDLTKQKEYNFEKASLNSELELTNKDIEGKNKLIESLKNKIANIREEIMALELDFMKPPFNWYKFLPILFFILGLGAYLMLFYSSSLYIMLYSAQDSMELIKEGVPLSDINPQVFESNAISKSFNKEGLAGYFVTLFFFVPLVIAYISHMKSDLREKRNGFDYLKMVLCYLIVFFIDAFIAVKVTNTIIDIKKEAKQIDPNFELTFGELLTDLNFWLVFCLGALPFIFLSILMDNLSNFFKERSPETEKKRLRHQKKGLVKNINDNNVEIDKIIEEIKIKEKEVVRIKNEIIQIDKKITFLPIEINNRKTSNDNLIDKRIEYIKNKASLFLNDIENDNITISTTTLNHRISAFLEGWNEYLHSQYAIPIAISKSEEAVKTIDKWLEEKTSVTKIS